jgi:signal transduction histidine kinase
MNQAADRDGSARSAEETLQRLAAALPLGVATLCRGRVVWANGRLLEMSGRESLGALVGTELEELLADSGHGLPAPSGAVRPRAVECTLRRPDGQERVVIWWPSWPEIAPDTDAWAVEDASHVRSLERELLQANRELHLLHREAAELRDRLRLERAEREELLTVVSHELRTPVTVMNGYHRLLIAQEVGPLNEEQRRFLEESSKSCKKLDAFIEKLMQASREPRASQVLEVCSAPLRPLIEEIASAFEPLLEERSEHIEVDVDPKLSRARFDRAAVEQVLTNLLGNAIRYTRKGGTIEIATRELRVNGREFVELSVSDEGPGVAPDDRQRIFEPYVQAGDESHAGGLGLGLAICKRLVEAHGGTISVSERPGGGSCFAFTLPGAQS